MKKQPAYNQLSLTVPEIEFFQEYCFTLEQGSYFDVKIRYLIFIDSQMIEAQDDNRVVNLFSKGSSKLECYLNCAKPISQRKGEPKYQISQSLVGTFQQAS